MDIRPNLIPPDGFRGDGAPFRGALVEHAGGGGPSTLAWAIFALVLVLLLLAIASLAIDAYYRHAASRPASGRRRSGPVPPRRRTQRGAGGARRPLCARRDPTRRVPAGEGRSPRNPGGADAGDPSEPGARGRRSTRAEQASPPPGKRGQVTLRAVLFDVDFTLAKPGPDLGPEGYRRLGARVRARPRPGALPGGARRGARDARAPPGAAPRRGALVRVHGADRRGMGGDAAGLARPRGRDDAGLGALGELRPLRRRAARARASCAGTA